MRINIITALLNENINYKLRKIENIYIKYDDIQYEDGIFEILNTEKNIDYIIFDEKLIEKNNIENTIQKIHKINSNIKFILVLENNDFNIEKIYHKNIIKIIYSSDENKILDQIIEIIKKEEKINLNNIFEINKKVYAENIREKNNGKIIIFCGISGSGKTLISAISAIKLSQKNKVLLINMDFYNNDFKILFKLKNNDEISHITDNLDLLSDSKIKNNKIINKYKNIYDYIIIDLKGNREEFFLNYFFRKKEKIILIINPNLINIKRSKNKYKNIINKKIDIIINKSSKYSINSRIIKKLFKLNILGEIKNYNLFDNLINSNLNNYSKIKNIKKIIKKIE